MRLHSELEKILDSDLFSNIALMYVGRDKSVEISKKREKDFFGSFENYGRESEIFAELLDKFKPYLINGSKSNSFHMFNNAFDEKSVALFNSIMNEIVNKTEGAE